MRAATHAAGGVGAAVGPKVSVAREYVSPGAGRVRDVANHGWESTVATLAPLASAAKDGARDAALKAKRKGLRAVGRQPEPSHRGRRFAGLLALGAAVGALGALVARRRRRLRWEDYDPAHALDALPEHTHSTKDAATEAVRRAADKTKTGADQAAGAVATSADRAAGTVASGAYQAADAVSAAAGTAAGSVKKGADTAAERAGAAGDGADDLIGRTTPSRNNR